MRLVAERIWGTYETAALLQTDLPSQISKTSRIIGAWLMPKLCADSKYSTCSTNTQINAYAITGSWSAGTAQAISCPGLSQERTIPPLWGRAGGRIFLCGWPPRPIPSFG